jgi:pimeloyl-ACP methyl ester carboxylesterase
MESYRGWGSRGRVVAGDLHIEVDTYGPSPADAPTLVFLHEGLGSVSLWKDFPRNLALRTGFGGMTYSRRGYGASDPAVLPREVSYMHDEAPALATLLAALGIDRPMLIGHSDGASIAILYGGEALRPAPLAIVVEAPHVFVEDVSVVTIARFKADQAKIAPRLQRHHELPAEDVFAGWADAWLLPAFRAWNIEASLPIITAPTLVIQGAEDAYGTWAQVDAVAQQVSGPVSVARIEACGHSPHVDQPAEVLDVMAQFLMTHLRAASPASSGPRPASPR